MTDDTPIKVPKRRQPHGRDWLQIALVIGLCLFILLFGYNRRGLNFDGLIDLQRKQNERIENARQLEQAREAVELQEELRKNSDSTLPGTSIERERIERIAKDSLFQSGALESQSDGAEPQSEGPRVIRQGPMETLKIRQSNVRRMSRPDAVAVRWHRPGYFAQWRLGE